MSRELGWKEFEPDSSGAPENPAEATIDPAPTPLPWTSESATVEPAMDPTAESPPPVADASGNAGAPPIPDTPTPATSSTAAGRGFRLGELIWLCLAVVDLFLALDFGLRAIAAGDSSFVQVVINVGNWLAGPFVGVLSHRTTPAVAHTTFWAALVAIVIYTLAAWLLIRLLRVLASPGAGHARPS
ncbi:MAG TPA: hypothetical protein VNH82_05065 [Candidatus Dormibacteraeota bacterium]|nr:hypothetical protein [Candidatus Dormibacteraeota bacterium]